MFNKFAIILGLAALLNPSVLLARGLLIPEDKKIAPLILIKQIVDFMLSQEIKLHKITTYTCTYFTYLF